MTKKENEFSLGMLIVVIVIATCLIVGVWNVLEWGFKFVTWFPKTQEKINKLELDVAILKDDVIMLPPQKDKFLCVSSCK